MSANNPNSPFSVQTDGEGNIRIMVFEQMIEARNGIIFEGITGDELLPIDYENGDDNSYCRLLDVVTADTKKVVVSPYVFALLILEGYVNPMKVQAGSRQYISYSHLVIQLYGTHKQELLMTVECVSESVFAQVYGSDYKHVVAFDADNKRQHREAD